MKRVFYTIGTMAVVMGVMSAGTAQAGSCQDDLKEVMAAWQKHLDTASHPGGPNESPTKETIKGVIEHGEKDCLAGKNNEAHENFGLARRHLGIKEFKGDR